jgi:hypothetical protein
MAGQKNIKVLKNAVDNQDKGGAMSDVKKTPDTFKTETAKPFGLFNLYTGELPWHKLSTPTFLH